MISPRTPPKNQKKCANGNKMTSKKKKPESDYLYYNLCENESLQWLVPGCDCHTTRPIEYSCHQEIPADGLKEIPDLPPVDGTPE